MLEVFIARRYTLYRDARDLASKIPPTTIVARFFVLCTLFVGNPSFKINITVVSEVFRK